MTLGENVRGGLSEIWGHKLRSALTLVGVVLGVLSINCMFSIVQGLRNGIGDLFTSLGFDGQFLIDPRPLGRDDASAWAHSSRGITLAEVEELRAKLEGEALVSAAYFTQREVAHPDAKGEVVHTMVQFNAGNEDFLRIRGWSVEKGRGLTLGDMTSLAQVTVLGPKVASDLFGEGDPIGKEIQALGMRLTVVGVLEKKKGPPGMDGESDTPFSGNIAYLPITTVMNYFRTPSVPVGISLKALPRADFRQVADDTVAFLRHHHRGVKDYNLENFAEEMLKAEQEVDKMLGHINVVLGCIAGSALLVGGIGILSVMLIAVNERLYEIGIRKAVGATDGEILLQFLVEASTLSGVGAVIGTGLAMLVIGALSSKFPWGLAVSVGGLSLASFFAIGIGLGFGLYPAWIAARMDPVEALRAS